MINQSNHAYLIGCNYYYAHLFFENDIDLFNKGQQMQYQKILSIFTLIDLTDNQLTGKIPEELRILKALISLNISRNNLTGEIPSSLGDMQDLESLDLSHNLLTRPIPDSLGNVNMLGYLDLSYNNLSGRIPQVRHLDTFGGLSYVGNAGLCGAPLNISCGTSAPPLEQPVKVEAEGEDNTWWAMAVGLCYGLGVGLVVRLLSFDRDGRRLYFQFLDDLIRTLCERLPRR
ncbi:putative receptor like protein 25 [Cryptomeria japonica]|uniref:putative receptor like protein 25 n=1 Tax=Cryptomeria japonica TaxID=3369 RepID=UPI0025ACB56E|nr:putative receptor like protein 25 [Cryptomeria japonica]